MFERFRKTRVPADEPGTVAVRERHETEVMDRPPERPTTVADRPADPDRTAVAERPTTVADRPADPDRTTVAERPTTVADRPADGDGAAVADRPADGDRAAVADRPAVAPRERRLGPVVAEDTLAAMHARQRDRFGGIRWGSAFFGLLSAVGLASILLGIVVAAGVAIGLSEVKDTANGTRDTIGLGGGIVLLVVLAIAWFCGGYVAGRMARFDGPRQGIGVWGWTVLVGAAVAILAAIGGDKYNIFQQLNLPNIAVNGTSLTTGGIIALICALVVTLIAAILGGLAGDRFHRRVDRMATREYVEALD